MPRLTTTNFIGMLITAMALALAAPPTLVDAAAFDGSAAGSDYAGVNGADAIDPAGSRTIDARKGTVTEATLEGLPDFAALQTFTGFSSYAGGAHPTNTVYYNSPRPDVRFTLSGLDLRSDTGGEKADVRQSTSDSSAYSLVTKALSGDATSTSMTLEIDFGQYHAPSQTFDGSVAPTGAVGFTITDVVGGTTFTVTFYNPNNVALSTQTFTGTDDADLNDADLNLSPAALGRDVFFSYQGNGSIAQAISRITIERVATDHPQTIQGLDDLGFTNIVVPEPGSLALMGLMGLLMLSRKQQRN